MDILKEVYDELQYMQVTKHLAEDLSTTKLITQEILERKRKLKQSIKKK